MPATRAGGAPRPPTERQRHDNASWGTQETTETAARTQQIPEITGTASTLSEQRGRHALEEQYTRYATQQESRATGEEHTFPTRIPAGRYDFSEYIEFARMGKPRPEHWIPRGYAPAHTFPMSRPEKLLWDALELQRNKLPDEVCTTFYTEGHPGLRRVQPSIDESLSQTPFEQVRLSEFQIFTIDTRALHYPTAVKGLWESTLHGAPWLLGTTCASADDAREHIRHNHKSVDHVPALYQHSKLLGQPHIEQGGYYYATALDPWDSRIYVAYRTNPYVIEAVKECALDALWQGGVIIGSEGRTAMHIGTLVFDVLVNNFKVDASICHSTARVSDVIDSWMHAPQEPPFPKPFPMAVIIRNHIG